jgi:DNA-binding NarL/FixJ family response regulator
MKPKTVVIIEDQTAIRQMLVQLLQSQPDFQVVGDFGDGHEALVHCLELKPDFIILDVMLPGLNGTEVLRRINKRLPHTRTLVFSGHQNAALVQEIIQAGAHGFVEKTANLEELKKGIRMVSEKGSYFGPEVCELLRISVLQPVALPQAPCDALSKREREILQLIAEGHSTRQIAQRLDISLKTAENHRANLMKKLGVHGVAGLTRYAIQNGLIEAPRLAQFSTSPMPQMAPETVLTAS